MLIDKEIIEDADKVARIVSLVRERANFVGDLWEQAAYFFVAPVTYDEKTVQKRWKEETPNQMKELIGLLEGIESFTPENTEHEVKSWIAEKNYNMGAIMNCFRLAVVGEPKGPHMFDIISIIGKQETIARINKAIESLS